LSARDFRLVSNEEKMLIINEIHAYQSKTLPSEETSLFTTASKHILGYHGKIN
jgi:hypothetical protein